MYIVTEPLEGETLHDRMRAGPHSHRKRADFALQIAKGLAAAHEESIVRRDLQPENAFIATDRRITILDCGLARVTGPATGADCTLSVATSPGQILGTPGLHVAAADPWLAGRLSR
jgi:serine/threonine protein kinase